MIEYYDQMKENPYTEFTVPNQGRRYKEGGQTVYWTSIKRDAAAKIRSQGMTSVSLVDGSKTPCLDIQEFGRTDGRDGVQTFAKWAVKD